ncbi:MAG: RHS repeat-associated core domain-containing protein [Synechococcaceae cyanobacterium SM2_3_1]|nr:RHS repeat-associated core domain-containing protein [Synechococcaceae cyanobacterium SM2_3_1]
MSAIGETGEETYSFDVDGRVEEIMREGSTLTLEHDTYDRLVQAGSVSYLYDGMNRRVKSTGSVEQNFLIAPTMGSGLESIHQIVDGTGEVIEEYIYTGITPLLRLEDSSKFYYLTDAIGSVIGLVDENGQKVSNFHYDGFGNLRSGPDIDIFDSVGGDFRFQGQWFDQSTGFYYLRSRDYDPVIGRFLSRDPIDYVQTIPESFDPYQYSFSSPFIFIDPNGNFTISQFNAAQNIQGQLANIRRYAASEAREYLTERLGDAIGNLVGSIFNSFLPGSSLGDDIYDNLNIEGIPDIFELDLSDLFCVYFEEVPLVELFRFFPLINPNGTPLQPGFNCNDRNSDQARRQIERNQLRGSRPDFLIIDGDFDVNNPNSFIIGDIKITERTVVDAILVEGTRANRQWEAMSNYARRFQALPFVGYISFIEAFPGRELGQGGAGISKSERRRVAAEALEQGVILAIANLYDN